MRTRTGDPHRPGLRRVRHGSGFRYLDRGGRAVDDPDELRRLRALAVPPAWTDEWICPGPNGHLQAVGTDDAGRRQYLCHEEFRARQDAAKHAHVREVAQALPRLRRRVSRQLAAGGLGKDRVLARGPRGGPQRRAARPVGRRDHRQCFRTWHATVLAAVKPSHGAPRRPGTGPWCGWCAK